MLLDKFMQNCFADLGDPSRAIFYRFKRSFDFQFYLDTVHYFLYRISLSSLRKSNQKLEVAIGRWNNPQRVSSDNGKCKFFNDYKGRIEYRLYTDK